MRFIIMHKTNAHWESGATPTPKLVARVGSLLGELKTAGVLDGGEGLRASSQGVRLIFSAGKRTVIKGPFAGDNELPAGFTIVHAASLDEAIAWATREAEILDDVEIDIRPVTEPWDIGLAPKPTPITTQRYMILRKATAATEEGSSPSPTQRAGMARLLDDIARVGVPVVNAAIRPSSRGRRYKNTRNGITVMDGPFVETKELLAGYVIVSAQSLEDACRCAERYINAVGAREVDVLELET
jgi:hypothetical protein